MMQSECTQEHSQPFLLAQPTLSPTEERDSSTADAKDVRIPMSSPTSIEPY